MSYGTLFVSPEDRLQPNLAKVYQDMIDAETRESIVPPDPTLDRIAQRLGQRYNSGTDSRVIVSQVKRFEKTGSLKSVKPDSNDHVAESTVTQKRVVPKRAPNPMRATTTLILNNQRPGEVHHVTKITEPYEPYFQAAPSSSAHNNSTPKMWPVDTMAPNVYTKRPSDVPLYDSEYRSHLGTQSFGHHPHATTLKKAILDTTGKMPLSPTISSRPCSQSEPITFNESFMTAQRQRTGRESNLSIQDQYMLTRPSDAFCPADSYCMPSMQSETVHSHSDSRSHMMKNSSYFSKSQSAPQLSALQQTLIQCGKLNLVDFQTTLPLQDKVDQGIAVQKVGLLQHAQWLKNSNHTTGVTSSQESGGSLVSGLSATGSRNEFAQEYETLRRAANEPTKRHLKTIRGVKPAKKVLEEGSLYSSMGSIDTDEAGSTATERMRTAKALNANKSITSISKPSTAQSRVTKHSKNSRPDVEKGGIELPNLHNSENPFRQKVRSKLVIAYAHDRPRQPNPRDPLDYKDETSIKTMGNFNLCIKPPIGIGSIPSQSEVTETLVTLTRKALLSYSTRVIEAGATLKALKDPRHMTPGLQAILALHKMFVHAAANNPNNWLLNRPQLTQVLNSAVPWLPAASKHRLLLSFDAENTGLIRYVRISTTLLCCSAPAMTELASSLNRARNKIFNNAENAEIFEYLGELIVISLIHGFYEECGGGTVLRVRNKDRDKILAKIAESTNSSLAGHPSTEITHNTSPNERKKGASFGVAAITDTESDRVGVGMRMQDLVEAFSCCASCIEDELRIAEESKEVLQYLFDLHQKDDLVAGSYLIEQAARDEEVRLAERAERIRLSMLATEADSTFSEIEEVDRGPKLKYTYRNGEHSISKVGHEPQTPMLKVPLRNKNSNIEHLINDPHAWRKNLPPNMRMSSSASTTSAPHSSSGAHQSGSPSGGKSLTEYPSVMLGGDSIAWTQHGSMANGFKHSTSQQFGQSSEMPFTHTANHSSGSMGTAQSNKIDVLHILKHGNLAAVKELPRISQDDLISAMKKHPRFLKEFIRQLRAMRLAAQPYVFFGSASIEDSISQFNRTNKMNNDKA